MNPRHEALRVRRALSRWGLVSVGLVVFGSLACSAPSSPARSAPVAPPPSGEILLVTGEFPPYTSSSLPGGGFFRQRVEEVLDRAAIPHRVVEAPWPRAKAMLRDGEAWASFPFGDSVEHRRDFLLSGGLATSSFRYFHLVDNPRITEDVSTFRGLSEFQGFVFGGARGYWYGDRGAFEALGIHSEWAMDTRGLVHMLKNRRIDFFMEDERTGWDVIRLLYPDEVSAFAVLPQRAVEREYGLLVSRSYPDSEALLARFDAALGEGDLP